MVNVKKPNFSRDFRSKAYIGIKKGAEAEIVVDENKNPKQIVVGGFGRYFGSFMISVNKEEAVYKLTGFFIIESDFYPEYVALNSLVRLAKKMKIKSIDFSPLFV